MLTLNPGELSSSQEDCVAHVWVEANKRRTGRVAAAGEILEMNGEDYARLISQGLTKG